MEHREWTASADSGGSGWEASAVSWVVISLGVEPASLTTVSIKACDVGVVAGWASGWPLT